MSFRQVSRFAKFALLALGLVASAPSVALPGFARQTGAECSSCHIGFSELTAKGRYFKMSGYTLGEKDWQPLSLGLLASRTSVDSARPGVSDEVPFKDDGRVVGQTAGLYYAGSITDRIGAFINFNQDLQNRRGELEMTDIRFSDTAKLAGKNLVWGFSVNNAPLVQDTWNTFGPYSSPFNSPGEKTGIKPPAGVVLDNMLNSRVVGATAYGWWDKSLYLELGGYRTADKVFSAFRFGIPKEERVVLKGLNPFWRAAYQFNFSEDKSLMVGAFGMDTKIYPDNTDSSGSTDKFRDVGIDANYQYDSDEHRLRATVAHVWEKQNLDASFARGLATNSSNDLSTTRARLTYYYQKKYGATLGYFNIKGSRDALRYETEDPGVGEPITGSANSSPRTNGYMAELSYLPAENLKVGLQYTAYAKFMGARNNYDGNGRDASDNNTLFLYAWLLF